MKTILLLTLVCGLPLVPFAGAKNDPDLLKDYAGWYVGEFTGSFRGESASQDASVRLPRKNRRKIELAVMIDGRERIVSGRINGIRVRPKRAVYRGVARVSYLGITASSTFRAVARQKKGFKTLRIPIYLSRSFFGERFTLSGRFLGRK